MAVADDPASVLTVRARPDDPRVVIERKQWTFVPAVGDQPPSSIRMAAGFKPGLIYELSYVARDPMLSALDSPASATCCPGFARIRLKALLRRSMFFCMASARLAD